MSQYEKYSQAVESNPLDFTSWTLLLSVVEKEANAERAVKTFDAFLANFPLCFGYWNKYAELLLKLDTAAAEEGGALSAEGRAKALAVYERGVAAAAHSVEMWLKYCVYAVDKSGQPPDAVRSVFRRALATVGSDPKSVSIWEKCLEFEAVHGTPSTVARVHLCALASPAQDVGAVWARLSPLVETLEDVAVLCSPADLASLAADGTLRPAIDAPTDDDATDAPGDAIDDGALATDKKARLLEACELLKAATAARQAARKVYEDAIRRPYFHAKPLDDKQLQNWRDYLTFEEAEAADTAATASTALQTDTAEIAAKAAAESAAAQQRVRTLYERCVVACANYSEFWKRYAAWATRAEGAEAGRSVLARACGVFLKHRPDIHLMHARALEDAGLVDEARAAHAKVTAEVAPGLVEAAVQRANFERRQGDHAAAMLACTELLERVDAVDETTRPYMAMFLARYQRQFARDGDGARRTLDDALAKAPQLKELWLAAYQLELSVSHDAADDHPGGDGGKGAEARVLGVFSRALDPATPLARADKHDLWLQCKEFVEDYAGEVSAVLKVGRDYQAWLEADDAEQRASRKRGADAAPAGEDAAKQGRHGGGGGYGQQPAAGGYLPSQYPTAY